VKLKFSNSSTGGKNSKTIDITSLIKVLDTIPEGKEVYLKEKRWKITKRHYLQQVWTDYFPLQRDKPLTN